MNDMFNLIDLKTWPRGQMFHYFSEIVPTSYSMTVDLDITRFRKSLQERGFKFFPAYLWLVTKMLNEQIEFKVAKVDGRLGYWECLTPLYAHFHEDDRTISLMWTVYDDDFHVFYRNYLENQRAYGDNHGVLSQHHLLPPANAYTVSSIPWIPFKHFAIHSVGDRPYYFPTIEVGKFREEHGKIKLPLSITVHHATTDGWHVNQFLEDLQQAMDHWDEACRSE
ncbi:MAG: chloramphenicol acetyltransferase CAT [Clostridia bacterium]|nr:chloramphenicol acetyltransferase CAT [Clostridia bacterium]